MKNILASICFVILNACQTHPGAVNTNYNVPVIPLVGDASQQYLQKPSAAAISGKLFVRLEISKILANSPVSLYKKVDDKWTLIDATTTDYEGNFKFTLKLYPGEYELRSMNTRFQGVLPVKLETKPVTDLIFETTIPRK